MKAPPGMKKTRTMRHTKTALPKQSGNNAVITKNDAIIGTLNTDGDDGDRK